MNRDVFISFSAEDAAIAGRMCEVLESSGLRCWIAPRNILAGRKWSESIIDAIHAARVMVLVLSAHSNDSDQVEREVERAAHHRVPIIPFVIEKVAVSRALEYFISTPHWMNAYEPPIEKHFTSLAQTLRSLFEVPQQNRPRAGRIESAPPVSTLPAALAPANHREPVASNVADSIAPPMKVTLLYKRGTEPDGYLLNLLHARLVSLGHSVFIDRHLTIGVEWAREIERRIRESDAVVALLSAASSRSEMLAYELQIARTARGVHGKPKILPVRVAYEGSLPPELAEVIGNLQYFAWKGEEDDGSLVEGLLTALSAPMAVERAVKLEAIGGAVPLDSNLYVVRGPDAEFATAVERRDAIVLIKGARQMGKTSLLARGMQQARNAGTRVVLSDLQKLDTAQFATAEAFYMALADSLADQLNLDARPEADWSARRGANQNFDRFLRRNVLGALNGSNSSHGATATKASLLWAMDEADRLFTCDFGIDVFALFRTWHNERALEPNGPWASLTLAIAYATEAHLFITDVNQSPFNVGTRLELTDFTIEQVEDLNRRHGSPLAAVTTLYELTGGQPFLVRRGLYDLSSGRLAEAELVECADQDDGPYGDHLRRLLVTLAREPAMCEVIRGVLRGESCPTLDSFYRLRSAGIITGASARQARLRCRIYATYLTRHLL